MLNRSRGCRRWPPAKTPVVLQIICCDSLELIRRKTVVRLLTSGYTSSILLHLKCTEVFAPLLSISLDFRSFRGDFVIVKRNRNDSYFRLLNVLGLVQEGLESLMP